MPFLYSATAISPNSDEYQYGVSALEDFFGDWEAKESAFVGSKLQTYLCPSTNTLVGNEAQRTLSVRLDHQARLYQSGKDAYLLSSGDDYQCVAASKICDGSYSLDLSALFPKDKLFLRSNVASNRYPCLHGQVNGLLPFMSLEVKVDAGHRKQTHQQAFYGSWNIYRQLILRALAEGDDTTNLEGIEHYCLGVFDDVLECWRYLPDPGNDADTTSNTIRIKSQLLSVEGACTTKSGSRRLYCPWAEAHCQARRHLQPSRAPAT